MTEHQIAQGLEIILAIDPGKATGWSTWTTIDGHAERIDYGVIHDGAAGLRGSFIERMFCRKIDRVVCERFDLDGRTKRPDITPKLIEGILLAWSWGSGVPIVFQPKSHKALVGREPKMRDDKLKEHGLWLTGKDVGHTDARDVNDSQLHALAYYRDRGHAPTMEHYWPDDSPSD